MKNKTIKTMLALAVAMFTFVGCSSSTNTEDTTVNTEDTTTEDTTSEETTKEEAKSGYDNILQLTVLDDGADDKVTTPWLNNTMATNLMFSRLFLQTYGSDEVEGDLASEYEVSEDGLTYTITLKDGLKWSDGSPLTVDDVKFSMETVLLAAQVNGIYSSAFKKIDGYDAFMEDKTKGLSGITTDGNVITIKLSTPYSIFIPVLAQFAIFPKSMIENEDPLTLHQSSFFSNPVTSGPYKLTEFSVGNYYKLGINENYHGEMPKIEGAVVYMVKDYVTAVENGKIDYITTNVPDEISKFNSMSSMTGYPIEMLFYRYLITNIKGTDGHKNEAMDNPKVREAIMYAIDREELAKSMYPDLAKVTNSGVLESDKANNGFKFEYNPEKAKQLLAESGYDLNRKLRLTYYYKDQTSIDFMEAIAYYLGEVGFKVELFHAANGSTDLYQTRAYDLALKGLGAAYINEWYGEYSSGNAFFKNIFSGDGEFDELINKLDKEQSPEKRTEILKELQALEQELLYKLPLFTVGEMAFLNTDKVSIPDNVVFGNSRYKYDIDFEKWEIK